MNSQQKPVVPDGPDHDVVPDVLPRAADVPRVHEERLAQPGEVVHRDEGREPAGDVEGVGGHRLRGRLPPVRILARLKHLLAGDQLPYLPAHGCVKCFKTPTGMDPNL